MTLSYCGETVRKHDPDRFLLSLFAPPAAREALWALYAFNHEIAKTREVVTETKLGLIRLQWWRDEVAKIYGGTVSRHQVLDPLAAAIRAHGLPKDLFDHLIYAREFDLEDRQPATAEGLVKYAEFTSVPLLALSLKCLGGAADEGRLRDVATGYALTGILRAVPALAAQRRCLLPEDAVNKYELFDGKGLEKIRAPAAAIAARAQELLTEKTGNGHADLHAALARMYVKQMAGAGYDLFSPKLRLPPFMREARLWWASLFSGS